MIRNRLALIGAGFTSAVVLISPDRPIRVACAAVLMACLLLATRKRQPAHQQ